MKSAPTIAFDYRPSRGIGIAAALICLAAAAAPWLSALAPLTRVALSLSALGLGMHALYRFWRPRFHRIAYRASGWILIDAHGAEHVAVLESHVHLGVLLSLGFKAAPGARLRVLLAPDNLDVATRRRLVLMLARAEIVHNP